MSPSSAIVETNAAAAPETTATAVIYLRVSSDGQVNKAHNPEGYSIPAQREACTRHAANLDATVIGEFVESGYSGTNLRRPALQNMLAQLPELAPTYVIFYDLSRVAREEGDAFWLLGEIKRSGAKLESTVERVDDSPQGLLLFAVMAGVNAFRSRGDAEKVKMGLARKHADGGTCGPARVGYVNVRESVDGREVAAIAPDPERADFVKLAFDLAATGEHTITTITEVLEEAGLRARPSRKRPSRPLSRAQVHRILRDDYFVGIVTHKGVKLPGRHQPLIDQATFDRVQEVLTGHRASGDRSHKHQHYLKGSIYCTCGKRLGYGRHRGKCGGIYEYFSCLSRVNRGGRCSAPYFPIEPTERAIVRRYKRETMKSQVQDKVRQALRDYVQTKAEVARRESDRHGRRLRELTGQQQKLVQLYYRNAVSEEVLEAEQQRIETERAQARLWSDAAIREETDVMGALDEALILLDDNHVLYETLPNNVRRLMNQAVFLQLIVLDPETVEAVRTPLYDEIARLAQELQEAKTTPQTAQKRPRTPQNQEVCPQDEPSPVSCARGSYVVQMVRRVGFEPTHPFGQGLLRAPRLPFRHRRTQGGQV